MATKKVTTSLVEVFKVRGESMGIAFNNLKQEKGFDNYNLEPDEAVELEPDTICNGAILKNSQKLHYQFVNNLETCIEEMITKWSFEKFDKNRKNNNK